MKRSIKKPIALAASFALVLAMTATSVFAAAIGTGVAKTSETTITVPKGITFINEDAVTSNGPDITFTYTVAPATVPAGTTVTDDGTGHTPNDSTPHTTAVHAGPADGLTLDASSLTFASSETFTTSAAGIEHQKNISMSVDLSKFDRPGVYRYVITDTTADSALFAAGMTRDDNYQDTRYIDVFVKRNATTGNFEVSGYALKTTNDSTTASSAKDPGYVVASDVEDGTPADTDRYETYNVLVRKQVEGTMGDLEHEFPFAITVANQSKPFLSAKGDINAAKAATASATTSLSTTLKHDQIYTIAGLSPKATFSVVETNDTPDLYTVTVSGKTSAIQVTENASAKTYSIAAGAVSTYDTDNSATSVNDLGAETNYEEVTYTNTLEEVSPTGLALRFGPWAVIFAAAIALLFVSRAGKDEDAR